jgi:hypothetical protein
MCHIERKGITGDWSAQFRESWIVAQSMSKKWRQKSSLKATKLFPALIHPVSEQLILREFTTSRDS